MQGWLAEQSRLPLSDEQLDNALRSAIGQAERNVRTVLQTRSDVVVQTSGDGLQLWIESYRDPEGNEVHDRDLSLALITVLDLEWDPETGTILGLSPASLVSQTADYVFGDPSALTFEIR